MGRSPFLRLSRVCARKRHNAQHAHGRACLLNETSTLWPVALRAPRLTDRPRSVNFICASTIASESERKEGQKENRVRETDDEIGAARVSKQQHTARSERFFAPRRDCDDLRADGDDACSRRYAKAKISECVMILLCELFARADELGRETDESDAFISHFISILCRLMLNQFPSIRTR